MPLKKEGSLFQVGMGLDQVPLRMLPLSLSITCDMDSKSWYYLLLAYQISLNTLEINPLYCSYKGTLSWFPGTKVKKTGSEPLIQEADPHIMKLAIGARM